MKYYFDISEEGNVRFFEVNLKDGILNKYKNINRTSVTPEDYHNLNFLKLLTLRAQLCDKFRLTINFFHSKNWNIYAIDNLYIYTHINTGLPLPDY